MHSISQNIPNTDRDKNTRDTYACVKDSRLPALRTQLNGFHPKHLAGSTRNDLMILSWPFARSGRQP